MYVNSKELLRRPNLAWYDDSVVSIEWHILPERKRPSTHPIRAADALRHELCLLGLSDRPENDMTITTLHLLASYFRLKLRYATDSPGCLSAQRSPQLTTTVASSMLYIINIFICRRIGDEQASSL